MIPDVRHPLTQRGNRREDVFFADEDRRRFLMSEEDAEEVYALRSHVQTGRLLGDEVFVAGLEKALGLILRRRKPGPPAGQKRNRR